MPLIVHRRGGVRRPNPRIPVVPPFTSDDQQQSDVPEASTSTAGRITENEEFEPGPKDLVDVRLILEKTGKLPPEVVDLIFDHAEYWASSTTTVDYRNLPGGHLVIRGGRPGEDRFLLRTEPIGLSHWSPASQDIWRREAKPWRPNPGAQAEFEYPKATLEVLADPPVPELKHPVRKIVFDIISFDQGWSDDHANRGTYRNSYTWFDAGLERFDQTIKCPEDCPDRKDPNYDERNIPTCAIRPLWPLSTSDPDTAPARYRHDLNPAPDHCIQHNKLAVRSAGQHRVEWRADDAIDPQSPAADELADAGRGRATGDGAFVRALKLGDMVTVWGRARYPGWLNHVERLEVKVYWSV